MILIYVRFFDISRMCSSDIDTIYLVEEVNSVLSLLLFALRHITDFNLRFN